MAIEFTGLNLSILGILGASITGHIISGVWFSALFSKQFLKYAGWSEEQKKKIMAETNMGVSILGSLIGKIICTIVFAILVHNLHITTMASAVFLAVVVWFGFTLTVCVNEVLWHGEMVQFYILNQACFLVMHVAMGVVYSLIAL